MKRTTCRGKQCLFRCGSRCLGEGLPWGSPEKCLMEAWLNGIWDNAIRNGTGELRLDGEAEEERLFRLWQELLRLHLQQYEQ